METISCRCPRCGININIQLADKGAPPPPKVIDLTLEASDDGVKTYSKPAQIEEKKHEEPK